MLFGHVHTTMLHALASLFLDELLNQGTLVQPDTSVNERLRRLAKIMLANTNKQTTSFSVQMLRCEQTLARIIASDAQDKMRTEAGLHLIGQITGGRGVHISAEGEARADEGAPGVGPPLFNNALQGDTAGEAEAKVEEADDEATTMEIGVAVGAGRPQGSHLRRRRVRISGRRMRVGDVTTGEGGRLQRLKELLRVGAEQHLIVRNSQRFEAELKWRPGCRLNQFIRAAPMFFHKPWFDHVSFRDANFRG